MTEWLWIWIWSSLPLSGGSKSTVNNLSSSLGALSKKCLQRSCKHRVISELSSDFLVTKVMPWFAQLRQLTKIRFFLSHPDSEKVLHAFITSRLKYCTALYSGISKWKTQRLLLIQTSATRLLTTTKRSDHISPVLASPHRSPVSVWIVLLVFKALNGHAPSYIFDLLTHTKSLMTSAPPAGPYFWFQKTVVSQKVTKPLP